MKHILFIALCLSCSFLSMAQEKTTTQNETGKNGQMDVKPEFPGGQQKMNEYIAANVKYPAEARKKKIEGRVYVKFVVNKEGKVTNASVLKPVDPLLDAEALRVISNMPQWKPGEKNGEKVSVYYTLPIAFKLDK